MKSLSHALTLVFLVLSSLSEAQNAENWKTYNDSLCTLSYPENWVVNNSLQPLAKLFLFSDLKDEKDNFRENVNLMIQKLPDPSVDLNKFVQVTETEVRDILPNSVMFINERRRNANGEFQHMVYSSDQGEYKLQFDQYYWVKNGKVIVLTFTCEQSEYDNYQLTVRRILDSFAFN
jgi:hypothetical protein